jgi:hypothetical protein
MLELDDNDLFSPENSQSAGMQSAHRPPIKLLTDEEQVGTVPEHTTVIADERADQSQDIPLTYLQQASAVLKAWDLSPSLAKLEKFHLTDDADTIMISVDKGYRVYLSPEED